MISLQGFVQAQQHSCYACAKYSVSWSLEFEFRGKVFNETGHALNMLKEIHAWKINLVIHYNMVCGALFLQRALSAHSVMSNFVVLFS